MNKALTLSKTILSNWDDDDVKFYLNNIKKYEVLSPEEEVAVFEKIKNGTEEEKTKARQIIMASNQRFVYSLAKEYAKGKDIMDIAQTATIGMEKAIDKFDATLGTRFMSYAVWYMRREILQSFNGESQMIRTTNKQKLMGALPKAKEKFIHEHQREPFSNELIDILQDDYNIKIKNESDLYDLTMLSISDTVIGDESTPSPIQTEFETYTASRNEYENEIDAEDNVHLVNTLLSICTEKEQIIIKMLFGIGYENPVSPEDVGLEMGMTTTRILQIKKNIIKKIRKAAVQFV